MAKVWRRPWSGMCSRLASLRIFSWSFATAHFVGDVGVYVQRGAAGDVTNDGGKRFDVHAMFLALANIVLAHMVYGSTCWGAFGLDGLAAAYPVPRYFVGFGRALAVRGGFSRGPLADIRAYTVCPCGPCFRRLFCSLLTMISIHYSCKYAC